MSKNDDVISILKKHDIRGKKAKRLAQAINEAEYKYPRLSESTARKIAENIADKVTVLYDERESQYERSKVRERVIDVLLGIFVGITANGIYEMLSYYVAIMNTIMNADVGKSKEMEGYVHEIESTAKKADELLPESSKTIFSSNFEEVTKFRDEYFKKIKEELRQDSIIRELMEKTGGEITLSVIVDGFERNFISNIVK